MRRFCQLHSFRHLDPQNPDPILHHDAKCFRKRQFIRRVWVVFVHDFFFCVEIVERCRKFSQISGDKMWRVLLPSSLYHFGEMRQQSLKRCCLPILWKSDFHRDLPSPLSKGPIARASPRIADMAPNRPQTRWTSQNQI